MAKKMRVEKKASHIKKTRKRSHRKASHKKTVVKA